MESNVKKHGIKVYMKGKTQPQTSDKVTTKGVGQKSKNTGQETRAKKRRAAQWGVNVYQNKLIGVQTSASLNAKNKTNTPLVREYRQSLGERSGSFGADFVPSNV